MKNLTKDNFFERKNTYVVWLILLVRFILFALCSSGFSDNESLGTFVIIGALGMLVSGYI